MTRALTLKTLEAKTVEVIAAEPKHSALSYAGLQLGGGREQRRPVGGERSPPSQ